MGSFNRDIHVATVLAPVADAFDTAPVSSYINLKYYENVKFVVVKGIGTTGTSTITVERASDLSHTGLEAIPFKYRRTPTGDTPGAWTDATAAGFTTTAGSNEQYEIEISGQLEGAADAGAKSFVRVKATEVVNSPVAGAIVAICSGGRYGTLKTAIA